MFLRTIGDYYIHLSEYNSELSKVSMILQKYTYILIFSPRHGGAKLTG